MDRLRGGALKDQTVTVIFSILLCSSSRFCSSRFYRREFVGAILTSRFNRRYFVGAHMSIAQLSGHGETRGFLSSYRLSELSFKLF